MATERMQNNSEIAVEIGRRRGGGERGALKRKYRVFSRAIREELRAFYETQQMTNDVTVLR